MAAMIQAPVIPGLHTPPTIEDLKFSSAVYNLLPGDADQPAVQDIHLQELAELFKRFNVQDKFGMHLIHGHFQLDQGKVMLGTALTSLRGCWTRATSIAGIKPADIHGHIFKLTESGEMKAYELSEFILKDNDTVMLDAKELKSWTSYRFTGLALDEAGVTELKGNQSHAKTIKKTHQVFIDGKTREDDPLVDLLRAEKIIY
ncbi:hypothetical protein C2857_000779 [Epichloe festucae Fl1]|uniref:Uncharacterized protein n=1 Tax=Epichloe festucae (strain Fl1) TaxID=877507 RepID=A0A7U3SN40_EPIFF|nr:hypothetical protein C2857_000779 [Epichloe festucae Fl1]